MNKEDLIIKVGRPILKWLAYLQLTFFFVLVSAPFVWVWIGWDSAWKVGLTGIWGMSVLRFSYYVTKKAIEGIVDKEIKSPSKSSVFEGRFKRRLREIMERENTKTTNQ